MMQKNRTSMQRTLTALSHQEPDRVPLFLLTTMHGSKELGISIREYFSKAENVYEGQLRLREKYKTDCYYPFFYAPLEAEICGGEVIYVEDGPPNTGRPILGDIEKIKSFSIPQVKEAKPLHKVLKTIEMLKAKARNEVPIVGVVMSPFSLPILQMGFDKYLYIMHFRKDLFDHLMQINEAFCVEWANAQLAAGATAVCYFDPVSSSTIVPRSLYQETGFRIAQRTITRIKGPTVTHFASGLCLPIADLVSQTGTVGVGVSTNEDIGQLEQTFQGKLSLLGNMNGIEMRNWSTQEARDIVKNILTKAAPGGGFILSDNHGEIPYQVPDAVLLAISEAVHEFGTYPIPTN